MRRSNQVLQETLPKEDRINKKLNELRGFVTFCQQIYMEDYIERPLCKYLEKGEENHLPNYIKTVTDFKNHFTTEDIYMETLSSGKEKQYVVYTKEEKQELIRIKKEDGQIIIVNENIMNEKNKKQKYDNDTLTIINNESLGKSIETPILIDLSARDEKIFNYQPLLNNQPKNTLTTNESATNHSFSFFNNINQDNRDHHLYTKDGELVAITNNTEVYVIPFKGSLCYPNTKAPIGEYYVKKNIAELSVVEENKNTIVPYTALKIGSNIKVISEENKPEDLVQVYKAGYNSKLMKIRY